MLTVSKRIAGAVLLLLTAACAKGGSAPPPVSTTSAVVTLPAPYEWRTTRNTQPSNSPIDDAAVLLGLPRLGEAILPDSARELRIGDDYGMMWATPEPVLRIIQDANGTVRGQWMFLWREASSQPRELRATHCSLWKDGMRICAYVSPATADWPAVLELFDALGVWTIGGSCNVTSRMTANGRLEMSSSHITDSGELHIGRIVGRAISSYGCNAPRSRTGTADGRAARALYLYFRSLADRAGGPPAA